MSKHNRERRRLYKLGETAKQKLRAWGERIGWGFKSKDQVDKLYLQYGQQLRKRV